MAYKFDLPLQQATTYIVPYVSISLWFINQSVSKSIEFFQSILQRLTISTY